jgi:hypothetical protein
MEDEEDNLEGHLFPIGLGRPAGKCLRPENVNDNGEISKKEYYGLHFF